MILKITLSDYNDKVVAQAVVVKYKSIASAERYHRLPKRFTLDGEETLKSCRIELVTAEYVNREYEGDIK